MIVDSNRILPQYLHIAVTAVDTAHIGIITYCILCLLGVLYSIRCRQRDTDRKCAIYVHTRRSVHRKLYGLFVFPVS
jgi:hypothetical protein